MSHHPSTRARLSRHDGHSKGAASFQRVLNAAQTTLQGIGPEEKGNEVPSPVTQSAISEIQEVLDGYVRFLQDFPEASRLLANPSFELEGRNLMVRAEAAIERISPRSTYAKNAERAWGFHGGVESQLQVMMGALGALKVDLQAGSLRSYKELLSANTFSDFLDMATELVAKGYKDAAAVIAGSVLEQHLRGLADKHGVGSMHGGKFKKADTLNAGLAKATVYGKTTQKQVTANLGTRNDAAHGEYDEYSAPDVVALIERVRAFVEAHPA